MKIFTINSVPYGSTANVSLRISREAEKEGVETWLSFGYSKHPLMELRGNYYKIGGFINKAFHIIFAKTTGYEGCASWLATKRLISKMKKISPDVIHLHNLHCWYINIPKLFSYIKKYNIKVVWTLHDCWAFTGHCPYYDMIGCEKWKSECHSCSQCNEYPKSFFDNSKKMHRLKKKWFLGVENMTIVTPSKWLADQVKQSFLKDYPVKVINNGIDISIFKPTESDFRKKYNIENKCILLGVAFGWGRRKGLDVFIELAKRLDEKFQIVLVGTDDNTDKLLPDNIISIHRTQNQQELAEIYTAADVFVNPTREENYPTVNMEALACGTPIITFNTGGSPEILDETCGIVVPKNDTDAMFEKINEIQSQTIFSKGACLEKAKSFDMNDRFHEYVKLYEKMC